jgi:hypothetical protein
VAGLRKLFSCILLLTLIVGCNHKSVDGEASGSNKNSDTPVNWTLNMVQLKDSLARLEPYLVDEKKFEAIANAAIIKKEIDIILVNSRNVIHNPTIVSRDPTVRIVASQFAQDIQRSAESFEQGKKEFSRYQLMKVTGYCIECHTRTQQGPQYEKPLLNKNLAGLSRFQRAEYLIATRYFDEGLTLLEEDIVAAAAENNFTRVERASKYGLMITVQFMQNPNRALAFVKKIEEAKGVPFAIKEKSKLWRKSILEWKAMKSPKDSSLTLAKLRVLADRKDSEVDQMRAIAGLLPFLAMEPKGAELGESLFLAGRCYESLSDLSLFSFYENYYTACIHSVPNSTWSKKCYERLEDSIQFGYSGSGGTHIPIEIQVQLDKLKAEAN